MKSPAFQFYPKDFMGDMNVVLMTNQEVGCYVKLMCFCWNEGSIPSDVNKIAKLCGEDGPAMAQLWTAIRPCFQPVEGDHSRLTHPRLDAERRKQEEHRKERAESGAKGAKARWDKASAVSPEHGSANGSANDSAIKEPIAKNASSSAPASSLDSNVVVVVNHDPAKTECLALVNRHFPKWVFSGERYKEFLDYEDQLPWALLLKAVQTTMAAGKTSLPYCLGICEKWAGANLKTLEDVDAYEKRRDGTKAEQAGASQPAAQRRGAYSELDH